MTRKRVLSGMRPTGRLHMGHLFGALDNWRKLQETYDCFFFIADWHALTTDYADPSKVREFTTEVVLDWLAAGLDPQKATFFVQSRLPEHAELHLLFSMFTPLAWLERVPTYKEQREQITDKDLSTYGFLGYPLLQAADILIYKAHYVPVGVDQVPHVELTREVARRFNFLYKTVLVEPEALLTEFPKIPGTDGRKMSKSYDNAIFLSDYPRGGDGQDQADDHGPGTQASERSRQSGGVSGLRSPQGVHPAGRTRDGRSSRAAPAPASAAWIASRFC